MRCTCEAVVVVGTVSGRCVVVGSVLCRCVAVGSVLCRCVAVGRVSADDGSCLSVVFGEFWGADIETVGVVYSLISFQVQQHAFLGLPVHLFVRRPHPSVPCCQYRVCIIGTFCLFGIPPLPPSLTNPKFCNFS